MTLHDLYLLSPELSMVIIASVVIALELLLKDKIANLKDKIEPDIIA